MSSSLAEASSGPHRQCSSDITLGAVIGVPLHLAQLADARGQAGEVEEGLLTLTEALTVIETTGERVYEAALHP